MKTPFTTAAFVALAVVALTAVVAAQPKPDFSGTWRLEKSSTGQGAPGAANAVIVITQDARTLTVKQAGFKTIVYRLDGAPAKNSRPGTSGEATYTTVWQGKKLVTTITGGLSGREERYIEGGLMVDFAEGQSSVGPSFARTLYWKKVK